MFFIVFGLHYLCTVKMKRYFIYLSYDGANYHGWQIQPNGSSVEETIEKAISTLLHHDIDIIGAGRTDAGVNASMMVAHFDIDDDAIADCRQLAYRLNRMLPRDIAIKCIEPVGSDMHARFSARSRTYHYYMHTLKDPFLRRYSWEVHYPLDFGLMNAAAAYLLGEKDFKCFCKAGADVKTTICNVTEAKFEVRSSGTDDADGRQYVFTITANRFLRNMVRAVVGTLVDVGRGRLTLEQFRAIVDNGTRSDAGESVPGYALFLSDIKY